MNEDHLPRSKSTFDPVEASAEAIMGAAAGSTVASVIGTSSVAAVALLPLAGAVALPFLVWRLRRTSR